MQQNSKVRNLTYAGLMIALVFVATAIVPHIPIPFTEGYIHTGDSMIFVAAILLGWKYGAVVGGVGSALADIFLGYTHWAVPTLIIKGIMGAIVGLMSHETKNHQMSFIKNALSLIIGIGWIVVTVFIKNLLTSQLSNLTDSTLANQLVTTFDLNDVSELIKLVQKVQTTLLISAILIPIAVIVLSLFLNRKDKTLFGIPSLMGMILAGTWMIIGYYIAGGIMKGNMLIPIFSVPSNLLQFIGGMAIAFAVILSLKKTKYFQQGY